MQCSAEGGDVEHYSGRAGGGVVEEEVEGVLLRLKDGFDGHLAYLLSFHLIYCSSEVFSCVAGVEHDAIDM